MNNTQFQLLVLVLATLATWLAYLKIKQISQQIREVHLALNSRLDQLIEVTRLQAHQRGMAEGLALQIKAAEGATE